MTLNWQPFVVPTGLQFNPGDTSFNNALFNFLIPLEASTPTQRQTITLVSDPKHPGQRNPTIGIGFDLRAGGTAVQNAVFTALGLVTSVLQSPPQPSDPNYAQEQAELGYLQRLQADIAVGAQAAVNDMNLVMAQRLAQYNTDPIFRAFVSNGDFGVTQRATFTFLNDTEVYTVFLTLWNSVYQKAIFNALPSLESDSNFGSSREMEVLASLVWNAGPGSPTKGPTIIGPGLRNAVTSGNRADAWFEIRYASNASKDPSAATRRYYESQVVASAGQRSRTKSRGHNRRTSGDTRAVPGNHSPG